MNFLNPWLEDVWTIKREVVLNTNKIHLIFSLLSMVLYLWYYYIYVSLCIILCVSYICGILLYYIQYHITQGNSVNITIVRMVFHLTWLQLSLLWWITMAKATWREKNWFGLSFQVTLHHWRMSGQENTNKAGIFW